MAWVSPSVRATGDLITASIWNVDLKDNLLYLKTETDKLDDVSWTEPARVKGTIYQNTGGKIRVVLISIQRVFETFPKPPYYKYHIAFL